MEDIQRLSARNSNQATRIVLAVREFGNSSGGDFKKLTDSELWRLRTGDWRIFLKLVTGGTAHVIGFSDR